ncbi:MAG: helix-turn-helix domain-containing protein [bacterium]
MIEAILKKIGLDDKQIAVYLSLLRLGASPVRKIALDAKINRGTTYDVLKGLMAEGLVSYFHQDKHKHFVCEDPSRLEKVITEKQSELVTTKNELASGLPELRSMYDRGGDKPVVKYYEGNRGIKTILESVIETVAVLPKKEYAVYSSSTIKDYLYRAYPKFSEDRIARGVRVRAIAIGKGGELRGLDQRRWLTKDEGSPTYSLIYGERVAMISVNKNKTPLGVIIEDESIANTHLFIFNRLWETLK